MNIKETHHSLNPSNISNPMSNQIKQFHLIPNQLQNKNAPQDDTGTTITNIAFITKGIQNYDIENFCLGTYIYYIKTNCHILALILKIF